MQTIEKSTYTTAGLDERLLFELAAAIYLNRPLTGEQFNHIESEIAPGGNLFILSEKVLLNPNTDLIIDPDRIWSLINNDRNAIFQTQAVAGRNRLPLNSSYFYLGKNLYSQKIAIGITGAFHGRHISPVGSADMEKINHLKRFYGEFTRSKSINRFLGDQNCEGLIINSIIERVVYKTTDKTSDHRSDIDESGIQLDKNRFFRNISKCTLLGVEYTLLVSDMTMENDNEQELKNVINKFSHKAKGKISAISAAAEQLSFQEGRPIDQSDLDLLRIVRKSALVISEYIDRLNSYARLDPSAVQEIDLNHLIKEIAEKRRKSSDRQADNLVLELEDNLQKVTGDNDQLNILIDELISNALFDRPDGTSIEIRTKQDDDRVILTITNKLQPTTTNRPIDTGRMMEPYFSTDSLRSGMGLTLARRIAANHNGELEVSIKQDDEIEVGVSLPGKKE